MENYSNFNKVIMSKIIKSKDLNILSKQFKEIKLEN